MQQDLLLQRDALAQAHQLGEFQKEYPVRVGKQIARGGIGLFILALILFDAIGSRDITAAIIWSLIASVVAGTLSGGLLYLNSRVHVYVYTGGLVYLYRNTRRAVRWEQITRVSNLGQYGFAFDVKDEQGIGFNTFTDRLRELYATIVHEVDAHAQSDQESDTSAVKTPRKTPRTPPTWLEGVTKALQVVVAIIVVPILIWIGISDVIRIATFATTPLPSYFSSTGTLAFADTLQGPVHWGNYTNAASGVSCHYTGGAFQVSEPKTNSFFDCLGPGTFSNVAFEVQMTIIGGDCGGIGFRDDPTNYKFYYFRVCGRATGSGGGLISEVAEARGCVL